MFYDQILEQIDAVRQDEKHLCRLYLFAGASRLNETRLAEIRRMIISRLHTDEEHFQILMRQASRDWLEKIERMDRLIIQSRCLDDFDRRNASVFRGKGIPAWKARTLIARLMCLSLQKVSIQTGKNHLKSKDLKLLIELLFSQDELRSCLDCLERPVVQAGKGVWTPTSEEFIGRSLIHCQILADYYQTVLDHQQGAKTAVLREMLKATRHMPLEDIHVLLSQGTPTQAESDPLPIASHRLDGLDQTLSESSPFDLPGDDFLFAAGDESFLIDEPAANLPEGNE